MWYFSEWLFEDQTLDRKGQIDSPAAHFASQAMIVTGWVKSEQRQAKAILAARRAMTATGIATRLHEDRHDVQAKTDRWIFGSASHIDRDIDGLAAEVNFDGCLSV